MTVCWTFKGHATAYSARNHNSLKLNRFINQFKTELINNNGCQGDLKWIQIPSKFIVYIWPTSKRTISEQLVSYWEAYIGVFWPNYQVHRGLLPVKSVHIGIFTQLKRCFRFCTLFASTCPRSFISDVHQIVARTLNWDFTLPDFLLIVAFSNRLSADSSLQGLSEARHNNEQGVYFYEHVLYNSISINKMWRLIYTCIPILFKHIFPFRVISDQLRVNSQQT